MRLSRLLPPTALLAAIFVLASVAATRANILIEIDKTKQQMTVTVDGDPRYLWPVSTGKESYDTPGGEFQPFRMERHHFSREWDDAPMPYSIFFTQEGHAIHGSYEVRRLGTPASHGCVRLSPDNAAMLFDLVKQQGVKNARVVLTGELPSATELTARHGSDVGNGSIIAEEPAPRPRKSRSLRDDDGYRLYSYREPYTVRRRFGPFPFGW